MHEKGARNLCVCVAFCVSGILYTAAPSFVLPLARSVHSDRCDLFGSRRAVKESALHARFNMLAEHVNAVGSRRAAGRIIAGAKQKENCATYVTECVVKVEAELPEVRDGILAVMKENLVSLASTGESTVLYSKMKGDYYRYQERVLAMPVPQSEFGSASLKKSLTFMSHK